MARQGIYLYGYYGQGNLGDDLLMTSAVRMIRAVRPDASIFVHCHDAARLPALSDPLLVPVEASARLADPALSRPARLKAYFAMLSRAFRNCDTLVFGGGTVFQDASSPVSLLIIAATVMFARRKGLKVITIGSGAGHLRTVAGRSAMKAILKRADIVCLRDATSMAICRALVPQALLRQTADLVFGLAPPAAIAAKRTGFVLSIQPSVTNRSDAPGERARQALRAVINAAVQRGERCLLLAFETKHPGGDGRDDRDAWQAVAGDLMSTHPGLVQPMGFAGPIDDVARIMAEARAHYGMRYHGHVLAALSGTPFAGLAHDVKVQQVCRSFAMPCLGLGEATTAQAIADLDTATGLAISKDTLSDLRVASQGNIQALRDGLEGTS